MQKEGKYIYCIIGSNEGRNFGPIGIGERKDIVTTIPYNDIATVVSNSPMTKYVISRENLTCHEKVIEKVMKDYSVLPVRFCTIATSAQEIRECLRKRYVEFKNLLGYVEGKVELGLKALWKDMQAIFKEIAEEDKKIRRLKEEAEDKTAKITRDDQIAVGERVKEILNEKQKKESSQIMNVLKRNCVDIRMNKTFGDNMILNAAFLIDRMREKEFDNRVADLTNRYKDRIEFKYVGPIPPFNFVEVVIKWTGK